MFVSQFLVRPRGKTVKLEGKSKKIKVNPGSSKLRPGKPFICVAQAPGRLHLGEQGGKKGGIKVDSRFLFVP